MDVINVKNLYRNAFGTEPPEDFALDKMPVPFFFSQLGQPFFEKDVFGREYFMPVKLGGIHLPMPVIGIRSRNNIVTTILPERPGTVKEMISAGDWEITIRGIIIREDNNFPELETRELVALFKRSRSQSLELRSALTDLVLTGENEHQVVIEDFDLPPVTGSISYKPYEFRLLSDSIFTLIAE